jgi:hypothetical protein
MTPLTREDMAAALGPVDEIVVAEIIGMGASAEELAEARAWIVNDEAFLNSGKSLASGRVRRLVDILATIEEEERETAGG